MAAPGVNHHAAALALRGPDSQVKHMAVGELQASSRKCFDWAQQAERSPDPIVQYYAELLNDLGRALTDPGLQFGPLGLAAAFRSRQVLDNFGRAPSIGAADELAVLRSEVRAASIWTPGNLLTMDALVPAQKLVALRFLDLHTTALPHKKCNDRAPEQDRALHEQRMAQQVAEENAFIWASTLTAFLTWCIERVSGDMSALHKFRVILTDALVDRVSAQELVQKMTTSDYLPAVLSVVATLIRGPIQRLLAKAGSLLLHSEHLAPTFRYTVRTAFTNMGDTLHTASMAREMGTVSEKRLMPGRPKHDVLYIDCLVEWLSWVAEGLAPAQPALGISTASGSHQLNSNARAQVAAAEQQRLQAAVGVTYATHEHAQAAHAYTQATQAGVGILLQHFGLTPQPASTATPGASPMYANPMPRLAFP